MKENEKALEEIQSAFYDVVDVVETNLPELTEAKPPQANVF